MNNQKKPTVLIILDGFGHAPPGEDNPINEQTMPVFMDLLKQYPYTLLHASGPYVGLPEGVMGNSQAGHTAIGAGRVIKQPVTIINDAINHNTLSSRRVLQEQLSAFSQTLNTLHIIGLLSDASVHSHESHLYAYINTAQTYGIKKIVIHPFVDGRDTPPRSAIQYFEHLEYALTEAEKKFPGTYFSIGSIHGRSYAMDRDHNWSLIAESYRVMTKDMNKKKISWREVLNEAYARGVSDEFIRPTQLDPENIIKHNDGVIFINFRPDRARELTNAFTDTSCILFNNIFYKPLKLEQIPLTFFITPVSYEHTGITIEEDYPHTTIVAGKDPKKNNQYAIFQSKILKNTLIDAIAQRNLKAFLIAETEKYAHVTYFLCGGREKPLPTETHIHIPSLKTVSFARRPEMSTERITYSVLTALKENIHDFYVINYANPDMVGHTGNLESTREALTLLDKQLERILHAVKTLDGVLYITSDHGKAEHMINQATNTPYTAHTTNPVYFVAIHPTNMVFSKKLLPQTSLTDIASTILNRLDQQ
jgi:2,3-bisphosphoglycerate-independent phosphoglycerate mutase